VLSTVESDTSPYLTPCPTRRSSDLGGYQDWYLDPVSGRCDALGSGCSPYPAALTISAQAASSITSIPSSAAFFIFDPAPGPATSRSVLALTDPDAFAPRSEEHTSEL